MSAQRATIGVMLLLCAAGCGRRESAPTPKGSAPTERGTSAPSESTKPVATATTVSAGPSDRCVACRDQSCGSEKRSCEDDATCARDMGCKDECKGDKACMKKCVKVAPAFAALGKCLVTKCKAECIAP